MSRQHEPRDVYFDDLADRFERNIYGSSKGDLRLTLLWEDLLDTVPAIAGHAPLQVLDAGGGLGQISERLAQAGHQVLFTEPSLAMLDKARARFAAASLPVDCRQLAIQDLSSQLEPHRFDLVVCHAVLEWLAEPLPTLASLLPLLKPGGWLSLAFYNRESVVWRNLLKGNVDRAFDSERSGERGGLTPLHPQDAPAVLDFLQRQGLVVHQVSGIRCLHDYLYPGVTVPAETMLEVERRLGHSEPYKWLGRYMHVMARAGGGTGV